MDFRVVDFLIRHQNAQCKVIQFYCCASSSAIAVLLLPSSMLEGSCTWDAFSSPFEVCWSCDGGYHSQSPFIEEMISTLHSFTRAGHIMDRILRDSLRIVTR